MSFPKIEVTQVKDPIAQQNFQIIQSYFVADPLARSSFKFFQTNPTAVDGTLTGLSAVMELEHNLGFTPQDIIVTKNSNNATVHFYWDRFTSTRIYYSVSVATTLRLLIGRYDG